MLKFIGALSLGLVVGKNITPKDLQRRLSIAGQEFEDGGITNECARMIRDYDECVSVDEDTTISYYYGSSILDDSAAECAYLKEGRSCQELVDDSDNTCISKFYAAVECYYSTICKVDVKCNDDPFESESRTITLYNAYPGDRNSVSVCFFWGSDPEYLDSTSEPLLYGEILTLDIDAGEKTQIGYAVSNDLASCENTIPLKLHALDLFISDVNTYGVGVTSDGAMGPKAWRSDIAGDPLSTIFVHEAKGYEHCEFSLLQGLTDLGGSIRIDDGVAQDLDCDDYRQARSVLVQCDEDSAVLHINSETIFARASQQFMVIGDKSNPEHFPLTILLVQANQNCDYVCGPQDPTPEFTGFDFFYAFDFFYSMTYDDLTEEKKNKTEDARRPHFNFLLSLFFISITAALAFLCLRRCLSCAFFVDEKADDDTVKRLKTPLLAESA